LIRDGEISVAPQTMGFSKLLNKPDARVGAGITDTGSLILAATKSPVTLTQWATTLRSLGAINAINFDGGSSTGMIYSGKALISPARQLTNAIAVYIR
jgi:exopolysaccharide biosynthesis protein